jgi:tetratricopeptide (TPR) repeat protein
MSIMEEIFRVKINHQRLKTLEPVNEAIEALNLPLLRFRKLNGILSALTMQIEDGGDHAEVNHLLVQALRAAVLAQVGPETGRTALEALARFEQAEARPPSAKQPASVKPTLVKVSQLIKHGYQFLEKFDSLSTCQRWLEAWQLVKELVSPDLPDLESFARAYPTLTFEFPNWCRELMFELNNAGIDDPAYYHSCLTYIDEFWRSFPAELRDAELVLCLERGKAEALWRLGQFEASEATFASLAERLPDEGWAYIGWADQYWLGSFSAKEFERGEPILQRALQRPTLKDRVDVLERMLSLYQEWGKPEEEADIQRQLDMIQPAHPSAYLPSLRAAQPATKSRPRHKKKKK